MLLPLIFFGQNKTSNTLKLKNSTATYFDDKVISFNNDSKTEEIIINVKDKTPVMDLNINGSVSYGTLKLEVFNPNGESVRRVKIKVKLKNPNKNGVSIGEINKFVKNPELGNWMVKLTGVKVTGKINIKANFENDYYINAQESFTPDGNGKNDTLILETYNISEVTSFQVLNKFGKVIFLTKNINKGWDGKVKSELQESGRYNYIVYAKTSSGLEVSKTGNFYLHNKSKKK